MAISTVPTVVTGDTWTAADHNTYIRDNLNEALKYQAAEDIMVGSGAGTVKRLPKGANGSVLGVNSSGQLAYRDIMKEIFYVGCIHMTTDSTNPATRWGFGTWQLEAKGRVLVGIDTGDADFNAAGKTGGAKTVTLTVNQMPSHTHAQNAHNHGVTFTDGHSFGAQNANTAYEALWGSKSGASVSNVTATNQSVGGGQAHDNMPPYYVCYIWRRTA